LCISFVDNITDTTNPNYAEPEDRIATFDNDGTLWCEYPDYVQYLFMFDRVRDMAPEHPEWNDKEPFSSILSGERFATAADLRRHLLEYDRRRIHNSGKRLAQ